MFNPWGPIYIFLLKYGVKLVQQPHKKHPRVRGSVLTEYRPEISDGDPRHSIFYVKNRTFYVFLSDNPYLFM